MSSTDTPSHTPYVPDESHMPEFTWRAIIAGAALGIVFGASSLYLVLKVGITVSASIPVAVLSITLFRALSQAFGFSKTTILENNIVQTAGSAGESIAFGVGVTMPALMLIGFDMTIGRVMVVSLLGGVLGILMMIPLRRAFIVNLHGKAGEPGKLLYPEGTACLRQVLITGEKGGSGGALAFLGFGIAFLHQIVTAAMGLLKDAAAYPLTWFNRSAVLQTALDPALLGVGYIIGVRTACIVMAGAVMGWLVIAPAITVFGDLATESKLPPGPTLVKDMNLGALRSNYLVYIGAGCVAAAGIMSMFRTLPMIIRSIGTGLSGLRGAAGPVDAAKPKRTEDDLPMTFVLGGSLALLALVAAFLTPEVGFSSALLGALMILIFGFLFVTVSSRLTGEIGSTSNPISGMTVATLCLTCLIFLMMGMTSPTERALALSIGAVVCIAASNGGTTSQDLKTGFLVGGTPRLQQWAIIIGALTSAIVIGGTLLLFNAAGTVHSAKPSSFEPVDDTVLKELTAAKAPTVRFVDKDVQRWAAGTAGGYYVLPLDEEKEVAAEGGGTRTAKSVVGRVYGLYGDRLAALTETGEYDGRTYKVWRPGRPDFPNSKPKHLVDDAGQVRYIVDPAITGRLSKRDDDSEVTLKFEAPKTQVMGVIINGVLGRELNWGLVLIGAMIAVTLELVGVSSLAFAVGVYVPMMYSVPIFIGGVVRWLVDDWISPAARHSDEATAVAATETGPAVLLSSGLIAGGTLAGVLVAFLEFELFESVKKAINVADSLKGGPLDTELPGLIVFAALAFFLLAAGAGLLTPRPTVAYPVKPTDGGEPK